MLQCCVTGDLDGAYRVMSHLWSLGYAPEDIIGIVFRVCKTHSMAEYLKLEFIKVCKWHYGVKQSSDRPWTPDLLCSPFRQSLKTFIYGHWDQVCCVISLSFFLCTFEILLLTYFSNNCIRCSKLTICCCCLHLKLARCVLCITYSGLSHLMLCRCSTTFQNELRKVLCKTRRLAVLKHKMFTLLMF